MGSALLEEHLELTDNTGIDEMAAEGKGQTHFFVYHPSHPGRPFAASSASHLRTCLDCFGHV